MNTHVVHCTEARHAAAILEIFNHAIQTSTALYEYKPRTMETMAAWFAAKRQGGFPVLGLEDDGGRLLGFASWGTWRAFPAYKYTVEHSVYVHPACRGQGLGRVLLQRLVDEAVTRGDVHVMIGAIDSGNAASLALHRALGFEDAGTVRQSGFKFGRWLDVVFLQRILAGPAEPRDG